MVVATLTVLLFIGLAVGSFLTVAVSDAAGRSWLVRARSRCPHCGRRLWFRDLFPVASFLAQLGRCRYCRQPIPRWHLWTELATVALFLLAYASGTRGIPLVFLLIFLTVLLALTILDLRFWVLPDFWVSALALVGLTRSLFLNFPPLQSAVVGGLLGLALLGGITVATRERAMGFGDVKLAGAMGLVLGWGPLLVALLLAFLVGGVFGAVLILLKRATLKSHIPFGPFLTGATAVLLLWPGVYGSVLRFVGLE